MRGKRIAAKVEGGFWGRLIERNRKATLPHVLAKCEESGYVHNLEVAAGTRDGEHRGGSHEDSDLYKTLEGLAYSLEQSADRALEKTLDELIQTIAEAQEADGYINSHFTAHKDKARYSDLHRSHELYCAGHLLEAAVAHFEVTGKRSLLDVAVRLADHLDQTFGLGKKETVPGHQELELALVRLSQATNEKRYLELARYFVDMRGNPARVEREYSGKPIIEGDRTPGRNRPPEYRQDHLPAIEQRHPIGHAVRAGYFYAAMADVAWAYSSGAHRMAVDAIWQDTVSKHLFLTGGVGTHQHRDEGFGDEYRLPNGSCYCETCGGIALMLFTLRMQRLNRDTRYADVVETILYNHMLACTDLAGLNFNYRNPLASDGDRKRHPWPNPACCPTNIVRMIPQVGRFAYSVNGNDLYLDQFLGSTLNVKLESGQVCLIQRTDYPRDGEIEIAVTPDAPQDFALHLRIPGWVDGRPVPSDLYVAEDVSGTAPLVAVNGEAVDSTERLRGYCVIKRTWQRGDRVTIELPMPVRRVHAHENVEADRGRVALMRGPLVYCLEAVDHGTDLDAMRIPAGSDLHARYDPDLLGGVTVINDETDALTAVPYYAWNNRERGKMRVWLAIQ